MSKRERVSICDELHAQGYLNAKELATDKAYGRKHYSKKVILAYCAIIKPVVLLMRRSKLFTKIVYRITHNVWLKHALK